jgi:hypothetical protein
MHAVEIDLAHSYIRLLLHQIRLLESRRTSPNRRLHPIKADREKAIRAAKQLLLIIDDDSTAMSSLRGASKLKAALLDFHRSIEDVTAGGRLRAPKSGHLALEREFLLGLTTDWHQLHSSPLRAHDRRALAQFAHWAGYSDRGTIDEVIATGERQYRENSRR